MLLPQMATKHTVNIFQMNTTGLTHATLLVWVPSFWLATWMVVCMTISNGFLCLLAAEGKKKIMISNRKDHEKNLEGNKTATLFNSSTFYANKQRFLYR